MFVARRSLPLLLFVSFMLAAAPVLAAPTLQSVSLRGLRIGHMNKIVLTGVEMNANPRVLIDGQAPPQKVVANAGNRLEVELSVPKDASTGPRHLRLSTDTGVSNALVVVLDDLPEAPMTNEIASLPIAMTGVLTGGQILKSEFAGKRGERVVAEVESRRLGSNARIVLRILDARGSQLAYSSRNMTLGGDARCEVVLPSDGQYSVQLHDVVYKGPSPGHFRLKIGDWKSVDFAMPLAVAAGSKSSVSFLGAEERIDIDAKDYADGDSLHVGVSRWQSSASVVVSSGKELLESPAAKKPQVLPPAPVGVTGVLADAGKEDQFLLPVKAGERIRCEVFANRVGSPIDGVLTIRGEKGNQLARNDDQNTTSDPRLDFTVPANVDKLLLGVSDIRARGGDNFIYRLAVRSLTRPDFQLTLVQDRINVPAGGVAMLRVEVARTAFNGPIALKFPGLSKDIEVAGDQIEAGANFAMVTLHSKRDQSYGAELRVIGEAVGVEPRVARAATLKTQPAYAATQPWLGAALAVGGAPQAPIRIQWGDDGRSELKTHLGGEQDISLTIDRNKDVQGDVRLKLLATQVIPKKKVKQNNKEVTIDDLERALRFPAGAKAAQADKQVVTKLLTPADLPDRVWSVVVQAELLSPKTKKPIATAYTNARTLRRIQPISLETKSAFAIEARAGAGNTGVLTGKVVRVEGFDKPVTVLLEGLPKGYTSPQVVVPPGATDFKLPLRFDAKAKPAELKGLRLVGLYRPNPKNAGLAVKTNAAPLTVIVVAGEKAKADEPKPEAKKPDEKKPADKKPDEKKAATKKP